MDSELNVSDDEQAFARPKKVAVASVRCDPRLMEHLRANAERNFRTVNAEIVMRLVQSVEQETQEEAA